MIILYVHVSVVISTFRVDAVCYDGHHCEGCSTCGACIGQSGKRLCTCVLSVDANLFGRGWDSLLISVTSQLLSDNSCIACDNSQ